jgi:hypothetical protein
MTEPLARSRSFIWRLRTSAQRSPTGPIPTHGRGSATGRLQVHQGMARMVISVGACSAAPGLGHLAPRRSISARSWFSAPPSRFCRALQESRALEDTLTVDEELQVRYRRRRTRASGACSARTACHPRLPGAVDRQRGTERSARAITAAGYKLNAPMISPPRSFIATRGRFSSTRRRGPSSVRRPAAPPSAPVAQRSVLPTR